MCKELALEEAIDLWLNKTMKMNESAVAQPGTQLGRGGGGVMAPPRQAERKGQENGRQNVKKKTICAKYKKINQVQFFKIHYFCYGRQKPTYATGYTISYYHHNHH